MPTADLTAYLPEPLTLTMDGREWTVQPPSARDGLVLAAIVTIQTVDAITASLTPEDRLKALSELPADLTNVIKDRAEDDIADLALGKDVHAAMIDSGLSAPAIDMAALYATTFWVTGSKAAADEQALAILRARRGETAEDERVTGASAPKDSAPPRTGHRTESGNQARTAGSPTTRHPRREPVRSTSGNRRRRKRRGRR